MDEAEARSALDALIRARGEDYASLSRLLGRNGAYIQQYIKRGVPRRLDAGDLRTLARHLQVDEAALGVAGAAPRDADGLTTITRHDRGRRIAFETGWLDEIAADGPDRLRLYRVEGDSMEPTLLAGDEIVIDGGDDAARLRDGIYALQVGEAVIVKRLAVFPTGRRFTIRSDNPAYPEWVDCTPESVVVLGRVTWFARRL